jgi:hypothetical protein
MNFDSTTQLMHVSLLWVIHIIKDPDEAYKGTRIYLKRLREIGVLWHD